MINSTLAIIVIIIIGLMLNRQLNKQPYELAEDYTCPYCYGLDFCDDLKSYNGGLRLNSFKDLFNNFVSVKNVFVTNNNIVLKKLGYREDFERIDRIILSAENSDYKEESRKLLNKQSTDVQNFKLCGDVNQFFTYISRLEKSSDFYKHVWTFLNLNVEPLILQMLKAEDGWPVPKYLGACGRLIAVEDAGESLMAFKDHSWLDRAYLSVQLLQAADYFTNKHADFRFYLTDISPDNIAVDSNLKVRIIDLENLVVTDKNNTALFGPYRTEIYDPSGFAYSENLICNSSISDHNYFFICQLLLWSKAPWPMMNGGLLHSMPEAIRDNYSHLTHTIDVCVEPPRDYSRIDVSSDLIHLLHEILDDYKYFDKII